ARPQGLAIAVRREYERGAARTADSGTGKCPDPARLVAWKPEDAYLGISVWSRHGHGTMSRRRGFGERRLAANGRDLDAECDLAVMVKPFEIARPGCDLREHWRHSDSNAASC